jgi:hypothetical protein
MTVEDAQAVRKGCHYAIVKLRLYDILISEGRVTVTSLKARSGLMHLRLGSQCGLSLPSPLSTAPYSIHGESSWSP